MSETGKALSRYQLRGEIASGGMATVYYGRLAGAGGFSRTIAIKRLHPQFAKSPEFLSAFLDEARLVSRIRHANVVPTLDVIAERDEVYIVMEYVPGDSLSSVLGILAKAGRTPPIDVTIAIVTSILRGLHAAHEATDEQGNALRIIHRDVSPHNILLGTDGAPRIIDFGVAKAQGQLHTTAPGQVKGKLAFMAPEQLRDENITARVDVYAAGIVLWEMLTGERVFKGDEVSVMYRVLVEKIPPPSSVVPGLPSELDAIVLKSVHRDPSQRYASALDFALALEDLVNPAPPARIARWLDEVAGDVVRARATRLAEIERTTAVFGSVPSTVAFDGGQAPSAVESLPRPVDADASVTRTTSSVAAVRASLASRSRIAIIVAAAVLVAMASAILFGVMMSSAPRTAATGRERPSPSATASTFVTNASASASASSASVPSASATSPLTAAASAPLPPTQPPPPTQPIARPTSIKTSAPPAPRPNCTSPYRVDERGIKHIRPECLSP